MATREDFKLSTAERQRRTFSEDFKKQKVREIEQKITTIAQVCKVYEVRDCAVRKWLDKYSSTYRKGVRLVVEMESDTKKILALQQKIADLERIVGQKQLVIDFQTKMIEIAEETYSIDIKKKLEPTPSSTSGNIEKSS
jgi:transposase